MNPLEPLINRVAALAAEAKSTPHFEWGVVTGASPVRVRLDGDAQPLLGTPSTLVSGLSVGDRVRVEIQNNRAVIMGRGGGEDLSRRPYAMASGLVTVSATGITTVSFPASRFTVAEPGFSATPRGHPNVIVEHIGVVTKTSAQVRAFTIGGGQVSATLTWLAWQMKEGSAWG